MHQKEFTSRIRSTQAQAQAQAESEAHSHVSLELGLAVDKYETTFDYTPAPLE